MRYCTFLSIFPTPANIKDGYIRRVEDIEGYFSGVYRKHLEISITKNFKKKVVKKENGTLEVHYLNAILHFYQIYQVLRGSKFIYSHSIIRIPKVLIQLLLIPRSIPLIIDIHGVIPEEEKMKGNKVVSFMYGLLEKYCFRRSCLTIHVTKSMIKYYRRKYSWYQGKVSVFYINNSSQDQIIEKDKKVSDERFSESDIVIIYSGNCQVWQNLDLMLDLILKSTNPNYRFLILTGQMQQFEVLLAEKGIPAGKVILKTVAPAELENYYTQAHYGFILRDNDVVNRVANPTKMGEYLQNGVIPIVKLVEIGDYHEWNYEYIHFSAFNDNLQKRKSYKNKDLFEKMKEKYRREDIKDLCINAAH